MITKYLKLHEQMYTALLDSGLAAMEIRYCPDSDDIEDDVSYIVHVVRVWVANPYPLHINVYHVQDVEAFPQLRLTRWDLVQLVHASNEKIGKIAASMLHM